MWTHKALLAAIDEERCRLSRRFYLLPALRQTRRGAQRRGILAAPRQCHKHLGLQSVLPFPIPIAPNRRPVGSQTGGRWHGEFFRILQKPKDLPSCQAQVRLLLMVASRLKRVVDPNLEFPELESSHGPHRLRGALLC